MFAWRDYLQVHPAAELFPPIAESELKELAEDIKKYGLHNPIIAWRNSDKELMLVDGRNRLDALATLGLLGVDKDGHLEFRTRPIDYGRFHMRSPGSRSVCSRPLSQHSPTAPNARTETRPNRRIARASAGEEQSADRRRCKGGSQDGRLRQIGDRGDWGNSPVEEDHRQGWQVAAGEEGEAGRSGEDRCEADHHLDH